MNLMLHGIGSDKDLPIIVADSLAADPGNRFDIVMTNPPFGKKRSTTIVGEEGQVSKKRDIVERDDFWATNSSPAIKPASTSSGSKTTPSKTPPIFPTPTSLPKKSSSTSKPPSNNSD